MTSLILYYEPLNGNVCEVKPKLSAATWNEKPAAHQTNENTVNISINIIVQIKLYAAYPGGSAV